MAYSGEVKSAENSVRRTPESAGDRYVPTHGNSGYVVLRYDLDLDYRVASNRLSGTAVITATATERLEKFSLDLTHLSAEKVTIGRERARFTTAHRKLRITPAKAIEAGAEFTVTVRYLGAPSPLRSSWGEVGFEELTEGVLVASQPNGASTWFPCNDHPSNKATFKIAITTDSPYRVIANGKLTSSVAKASRTRWVFESKQPMATYLATLQIGYYKGIEMPKSDVRERAFIPDDLTDNFVHDFAGQPAMIETFERLFGEYPFDEYTVVVTDDELEIPLEAQGLSIFGRNHVDGEGGSNRLIAHELAHSWFGNSLTVEEWKHIWLHEGFACYSEWLWSENSGGQSANQLAEHYWMKLHSLPQDFAIGDPGPDLMFDDRVYKRGALALHSLRLMLGDSGFFSMLRDWTSENRHGSVTTDQFIAHVSVRTERPVAEVLNHWLFDHALPKLPRVTRGK